MLDLSRLNPEQREAVTTTEGPLLVVAGPGSGKTAVIAARVAYIIDQGLARPSEVLAVTFTNKAGRELKRRLASVLGESAARGLGGHLPRLRPAASCASGAATSASTPTTCRSTPTRRTGAPP